MIIKSFSVSRVSAATLALGGRVSSAERRSTPGARPTKRSANRRLDTPDVAPHQINQMLERRALLFRRPGLRRNAIADPRALIQIVRPPDPARALRSFENAPQSHRVHIGYVVLQFFDIVDERGIHAPVILVVFKLEQLPIDKTAKTHLSIGRNKELSKGVDIFQTIIDKSNGLEIAALSGKRRPLCKRVGIYRRRVDPAEQGLQR